ncbi:hypothetical protein LXM94_25015 [Rhizobium sp. TRM95111]|uniref:hypothetical protein n=1 Tax=Rhizobium alarense TaxID=2846851 RepID=UPI001F2E10DC|nr:hypothetical protein [Rhizobium alarense]MCF3643223.1 hypothetical protein [Rhizobium alarense]
MTDHDAEFITAALNAALVALDRVSRDLTYSPDDLIAAAMALDILAMKGDILRRIATESAFAGSLIGQQVASQTARMLRNVRPDAFTEPPTVH